MTLMTCYRLFAKIYSVECMPALGHLVSLLLHMIEHEKKRELRISCLSCLCACAQNHIERELYSQ